MTLRFKSLRSSSSGNSVLVFSDSTKILIDCGLGSMKKTRQVLESCAGGIDSIDAVVVSHLHSDHISYYPLRVLDEAGVNLKIYNGCEEMLIEKHFRGYGFKGLNVELFDENSFEIGDLTICPVKLGHHPNYDTFGFEIYHKAGADWKKFTIATDFFDGSQVAERFVDSDAIFLESNHDLELLRENFNYNSRYHLSNPKAAELLHDIWSASGGRISKVMLGHLSKLRNTSALAIDEFENLFARKGMAMDFELLAAPADIDSEVIEIL